MAFRQTLHEEREGYLLSDDPKLIDVDKVHSWISDQSYWANGRSREMMVRALEGSHPIGVYRGTEQVAICRMVTDGATFAWLCDLFVDASVRAIGIGTWLANSCVAWANAMDIKRVLLVTRDAHEVYVRVGFAPLEDGSRWMEIDPRANRASRFSESAVPEN